MATNWNDSADVMRRRQAAINAGYKAADVDKFILSKKQENAQANLAQEGVLDVGELAKSSPILAEKLIKQGVKPQVKLTDDEKKKVAAKENADRVLSQLENLYFKGGQTKGLAAGRTGGTKEKIKEKLGKNEQLRTYSAAKLSSRPGLARSLGEVGPLTEAEQEAAIKLLPSEYSTPEEAFVGFRELRSKLGLGESKRLKQIEANFKGGKPTSQAPQRQGISTNPITDKLAGIGEFEANAGKKALGFLFPRTKQLAQDTIQGQMAPPQSGRQLFGSGNPLTDLITGQGQARRVAPATAELATAALPLTRLGLLKGGALAGGATGATTPDASLQERLQKTGTGAVGGALLGGILKGGGKVSEAIGGSSKKLVTQLFKPNASELRDFKRFTGFNFADEVMKRDLPFIKGKSGQQVLEYYTTKVDELENASDEFLGQAEGLIKKNDVLEIINKNVGSRKNRVLQGGAKNQLGELMDDIAALPDDINLQSLNQIKRDLQTAGKAAYGPSGNPSPSSEALSSVAREINNLLEKKAPGIKDVNKSVMFYRMAKDTIERKVNQASASEGGMVSQLLSGAAGAGVASGNPALLAPVLMNMLYRSPRVKSRVAASTSGVGNVQLPEALKKLLLIGGGRAGAEL